MSSISTEGLKKEFGKVVAVRGVTFAIEPGEFVGLVGPNGAGKSTTLKMLTGQLIPTTGSIQIDEVDVVEDPGLARAKIGYVPEEPKLYEYLSAREMIEFVISVRGAGDVDFGLEVANLGTAADRLIREYSQGMKRRTALATAMVARPPVLILDEALNGLDPPSAERVIKVLQEACQDGATVLLSTHVLDTLERVASRIIMISQGRVLTDVPVDQLDEVRGMFESP